jgi:branched-chain amino acid aminotransferase
LFVLLWKEKHDMNECYGKKFILNGMLQPSGLFENSMVYEGDSIYEVIRMVKGIPVFFSDHMDRLFSSVRLQGKEKLTDKDVIRRDIINLTKTDKKKEINLKIVFNYTRNSSNYLIYFIEPIYPSEEQYRRGVKGILFYGERSNPESKVINHKLRSSIFHKLIMQGAYEALLVNRENCITEGSRSNIFFLKNNKLVTAPDEKILSGITRKYILDICREKKINLEFNCIPVETLHEYDAVFMTGTSPTVLPFYCIEDHIFNVKVQLIENLRRLYLEMADESIGKFIMDV